MRADFPLEVRRSALHGNPGKGHRGQAGQVAAGRPTRPEPTQTTPAAMAVAPPGKAGPQRVCLTITTGDT